MPKNVILGIHSNLDGTGDFTGGHAWLTITRGGTTTFYGLWPDAHPNVVDNGPLSDIRIGTEAGYTAVASRYYMLTTAQEKQFDALVKANVTWGYFHNCSSFASDVVNSLINEDVDADDNMGIETPRELGRNILILEAASPTSILAPKPVVAPPTPGSSSF